MGAQVSELQDAELIHSLLATERQLIAAPRELALGRRHLRGLQDQVVAQAQAQLETPSQSRRPPSEPLAPSPSRATPTPKARLQPAAPPTPLA